MPLRRRAKEPVRRARGARPLRRCPVLLLRHQRQRHAGRAGRAQRQSALQPGEPDRAARGRRPGIACPGEHPNANRAYMVMASLAWTLKAWMALSLPISLRWRDKHRAERDAWLRMKFRTFVNAVINIPAQVVRTGRTLVIRLLAWRPGLPIFLRLEDHVTVAPPREHGAHDGGRSTSSPRRDRPMTRCQMPPPRSKSATAHERALAAGAVSARSPFRGRLIWG